MGRFYLIIAVIAGMTAAATAQNSADEGVAAGNAPVLAIGLSKKADD